MPIATKHTQDKRGLLVDAALRVIERRGLAGTTTKEIAAEAGVSEGTIYNHFDDRADLCLAVVSSRMAELFAGLPERSGKRSVRGTLIDAMQERLEVLDGILPLMSAVVGDPTLAEQFRARMASALDPRRPFEALSAYLSAEQDAGRIGTEVDARMLARLLLGTAFHHSFMCHAIGEQRMEIRGRRFVEGLVDATLAAAGCPKGTG